MMMHARSSCVRLPTLQATQWGQRNFEIDFEILVIIVMFEVSKRLDKLAKLKKHFNEVNWGLWEGPPGFIGGLSGSVWGILGSDRGSLGVYPTGVC